MADRPVRGLPRYITAAPHSPVARACCVAQGRFWDDARIPILHVASRCPISIHRQVTEPVCLPRTLNSHRSLSCDSMPVPDGVLFAKSEFSELWQVLKSKVTINWFQIRANPVYWRLGRIGNGATRLKVPLLSPPLGQAFF